MVDPLGVMFRLVLIAFSLRSLSSRRYWIIYDFCLLLCLVQVYCLVLWQLFLYISRRFFRYATLRVMSLLFIDQRYFLWNYMHYILFLCGGYNFSFSYYFFCVPVQYYLFTTFHLVLRFIYVISRDILVTINFLATTPAIQ